MDRLFAGVLRAGHVVLAALLGVCVARGDRSYFIPLGDLPGGDFESNAYGISGDGATVVGAGSTTYGWFPNAAFRWTGEDGMQELGDFDGGRYESEATQVSADGTVVVGVGTPGNYGRHSGGPPRTAWSIWESWRADKTIAGPAPCRATGRSLWETVDRRTRGRITWKHSGGPKRTE
jgi:hypothetical protein